MNPELFLVCGSIVFKGCTLSETVYEDWGYADCGGDNDACFGETVEFTSENFPVHVALRVDGGAMINQVLS